MKKAYEKPMVTIARFDVEEWNCGSAICTCPINPGQTQKGYPENCPQLNP